MLDEYTSLTGITFNYTDDSDSSIEGESTDKQKKKVYSLNSLVERKNNILVCNI